MSFMQMSVAGAPMILFTTVIRALAINRVPKKTFLVLWGAALMRLLIPFSLPSAMSVYSLLRQNASPVMANAPAAVLSVSASEQVAAVAPQTGAASAWTLPVWGIVWIVGLIICAAFFTVTYFRCYREFQMSLPVKNDAVRCWLETHKLSRSISVRQSDRISSPLTFGVLRPVILMPKRTDWQDETALRYVLEHEFVHIQRFDTVFKLFLIAAVCMHWFNPLVWVMYVLANRDIELACDETVVKRFGSGTRASYAKVLISMEAARSGLAPLCNHFSRNAIEERITAIMKTQKTTIISLIMAAALITGTVTAFATSEKTEEGGVQAAQVTYAFSSGDAITSGNAIESGDAPEVSEEYAAIGITAKGSEWHYGGKPIVGIYDDNGGIYMSSVSDGVYLNVSRDEKGGVTGAVILTKAQFRELIDIHMNLTAPNDEQETLMSYKNPIDGNTYYSFDDGKTFEPLTDAEFEALFPTPDIEWWTYEGYKEWLESEKLNLQSMLGEKGWTSSEGEFTWTQEKIDETIALYESILAEIKNGVMYSKTIDGQEDMAISCNPADQAMGVSAEG